MKNGKPLLLLLALLLLLTIPLALTFQHTVREAIVIPLLYLLWLGRLIYLSIPQPLLWAAFLALALFIIVKSLGERPGPLARPRKMEARYGGRVTAWAGRLYLATQGDYFKWRLARDLGQLGLELMAYRERLSPGQRDVYREIEKLAAPPEVQAFFRAGLSLPSSRPLGLFSRLTRWLRRDTIASSLDLDPESIVQWLEDQMGDQDDRRNRASTE
jgi:hypothetical protein